MQIRQKYHFAPVKQNLVTMVMLATGHQVPCILWVQVAIFNKKTACLCGLKFFSYFMKNTYNQVYVWCCKYAKNTVKDVPMNYYELLNLQACSFLMFWNSGCTQSPVVSCKYWVVPLISTRVSGYSHVMLFITKLSLTCINFVHIPHNSCAVVACAKFWSDCLVKSWIAECYFCWIGIVSEVMLVRQAPELWYCYLYL